VATVAVAGPLSSMPISPKNSPGPRLAAGLPPLVTWTVPLVRMKKDSVGLPLLDHRLAGPQADLVHPAGEELQFALP